MSRYDVQARFEGIGKKGQLLIEKSTIIIVGVGALGSVCAEQLTRAGVGKLVLIDFDKVELSNLQRQTLYSEKDVKKYKVVAAKKRLNQINKEVKIEVINKKIDSNIKLPKTDIILDCTDNIKTRLILNDYAIKNNITMISGLAAGSEGMVFITQKNGPCLRCFLETKNDKKAADLGIINSITSIIASMQTTQCLKIITKKKIENNIIKFDVWNNNFYSIKIKPKKGCQCRK